MARNIINAKGDLIVGTADDTPTALAIGATNGHTLTVSSSAATGVAWGQIVEASIATSAVTTSKIADNAVTSAKIADNAVGASELADSAVDTAAIVDSAVTTVKIADSNVTTAKIADSNVTTVKIADSNVTTGKLAALAVTGAKIANSTIAAGKLDTLYCQSGTGTGQSGNVVKIGWSPQSNLRVQVDATDFGATWPINVTGSSTSVTSQTSANTAYAVVARASDGSFSAGSITCGGLDAAGGRAGFFGYTTTNGDGVLRAGAYDNRHTAITTNQVAGNYHMAYYSNGNNIGSIYGTSSNVSFNTTSDYRLKENVIPLTNALSIVEQIKPKTFNFISDPETHQDGFIAHELAEVIPYAVTGEKDAVDEEGKIKPQQVDYSKLVAVLVGAVQELTARVKELENNK
jgi:hypothetical protein